MNRYIGWALLIAFFLGIHLRADEAIKISARATMIAAQEFALLKVIVERNAGSFAARSACAKTHVLSAVTQRARRVDTPCRKNEPVDLGVFNAKTAN
jgi:hypothetical protein